MKIYENGFSKFFMEKLMDRYKCRFVIVSGYNNDDVKMSFELVTLQYILSWRHPYVQCILNKRDKFCAIDFNYTPCINRVSWLNSWN